MTKLIPLTQGKFAIVDDEDYTQLNNVKWYTFKSRGSWYAARNISGRPTFMHRLILNLKKGEYTDHINGDGLDNRRANLRVATRSQNAMNSRKGISSSSIFKGVSYHKKNKKWVALIGSHYLGSFSTQPEAARAYDAAAKKLFGEYASLNFPIKEVENVE